MGCVGSKVLADAYESRDQHTCALKGVIGKIIAFNNTVVGVLM
jgi:hypothetical protein